MPHLEHSSALSAHDPHNSQPHLNVSRFHSMNAGCVSSINSVHCAQTGVSSSLSHSSSVGAEEEEEGRRRTGVSDAVVGWVEEEEDMRERDRENGGKLGTESTDRGK